MDNNHNHNSSSRHPEGENSSSSSNGKRKQQRRKRVRFSRFREVRSWPQKLEQLANLARKPYTAAGGAGRSATDLLLCGSGGCCSSMFANSTLVSYSLGFAPLVCPLFGLTVHFIFPTISQFLLSGCSRRSATRRRWPTPRCRRSTSSPPPPPSLCSCSARCWAGALPRWTRSTGSRFVDNGHTYKKETLISGTGPQFIYLLRQTIRRKIASLYCLKKWNIECSHQSQKEEAN
jgi:hypothetical protein